MTVRDITRLIVLPAMNLQRKAWFNNNAFLFAEMMEKGRKKNITFFFLPLMFTLFPVIFFFTVFTTVFLSFGISQDKDMIQFLFD